MRDNDLIRLFRPIIQDGLIALGLGVIPVVQAYQPTQQGVSSSSTVYYHKIGDHRYGFLGRTNKWDQNSSTMVHTEIQQYETTFQINALAIQDPNDTNSYTASDLVNAVASIMQSDNTRRILMASEVGILRVTDVRNPYFADDKDRFEASPSFDFTLTHKMVNVSTEPIVESVEYGIYRV